MDWREAFLRQARSDFALLGRLNDPQVPYCHRLHYLQMTAEKLAKSFLVQPGCADPPRFSHAALVRMLQTLKNRPEISEQLGFPETRVFGRYIDALLPLAREIERLAPSHAGLTQPNPEYPWRHPGTAEIHVPAEFGFQPFDPTNPRMIKIHQILAGLLRIE